MLIRVDTKLGTALLEQPDETGKLAVLVIGDGDAVTPLRVFGRIDGDHAWIDQDALKAAAAGRVPDSWIESFAQMVDYATAQGWVSDAGELRAHIEREDAPPEKRRRFLR